MSNDVTIINIKNHSCPSMPIMPTCCAPFMPASCFGYGFPTCPPIFCGGCDCNFPARLGADLGFAFGSACIQLVPKLFSGISKSCSFLWNKGIVPAAKWVGNGFSNIWNKGIVPAAKWVGNTIAKGCKAVKNGVVNCWNKIFHKKTSKN